MDYGNIYCKSWKEMLKIFNGPIGSLSYKERMYYINRMLAHDEYRVKLIEETEIIRRLTKRQLAEVLPKIWKDERIDHTRVTLLIQLYKGKENTSDKIIKSLKMDEEVKHFYLNKYHAYIVYAKIKGLKTLFKGENKLEDVDYTYMFDEKWGRVKM